MPTVTRDTADDFAVSAARVDPASRARRIIGSAREHGGDPSGLRALTAALARFDAPTDLRIRGGLGSGRRTLASALRERRGWRASLDDLDVLAAARGPVGVAPDVEILCLRTAPCRHEESWIRRPRRHPLLVVATGIDGRTPPPWAERLPSVDARLAADTSLDPVIGFVDRALDASSGVRLLRLASELERLAVDPTVGDLAEAALCSLHEGGSLHEGACSLHEGAGGAAETS